MADESEDRIGIFSQEVEDIRAEVADLRAMVEESLPRNEPDGAMTGLVRAVLDLSARIAALESRMSDAETGAAGPTGEEGGSGESAELGEPGEPYAPGAHDEIEPDSNVHAEGETPDRSLQWVPEKTSVLEINEFHNAPSIGVVKVRKKGRKIVLTDPDGNTGSAKWMMPLRRDASGTKELKWALIGADSDSDPDSDPDSDSDSDSDEPYIPDPDDFWLRGGNAQTNYGVSLKLGQNNSYITISAS